MVNGFAESTSNTTNKFKKAPNGDTLLGYLKSQDRKEVKEAFDKIIEKNVESLRKKGCFRKHVPIAIDWHDVMYYGNPKIPMVIGTQHKKGSNYAFEYLTSSVLVDGERLIIAVLPIASRKDVSSLTIRIIRRIQELGIKIHYITVDGGFFTIDVIKFLEKSKLKYILHMPSTNKTRKMRLWDGRRFRYKTSHRSREQISFDVIVAYDKAKKYKYLFATNIHYKTKIILKLFNRRWGIETSYRMTNQFMIKTTSKSYTLRLFYYLFACLMYNCWVVHNRSKKEHTTVIEMKMRLIVLLTLGEDNIIYT